MEATDIEHSLEIEDEFDALSIEVKVPDCLPVGNNQKYPAKLHARKVAKALGAHDGIIYLPGQWDSTYEDSDQGPPFRQRRYFYYLSGINFPCCSITYDIEVDKLTLWIPYTPPATILWFGNTPSPEDCLARSDVHDVQYTNFLPDYLTSRLSKVKNLYVLRPSQLPKFQEFQSLKPRLHIDTTTLQPIMDQARVIKSEYEIAMIRKANAVSSEAHKHIARSMHRFTNECQLEAAFLSSCTNQNAHSQAYNIIAGSGTNASTLHYDANNEPLAGKGLVVLDAGAEWDCYASDVTRTLPIGPDFSPEARAIYDLVHQMQDECIQRVRPGVEFRDLQLHATLVAVKGLLRLGILHNGTADEIFKNGTGSAFFPHGLGHHVGLDVHDVLSKELLRPGADSMWGKRRPIGPSSLIAMIKQANKPSTPTNTTSTTSTTTATTATTTTTSTTPTKTKTTPTKTTTPTKATTPTKTTTPSPTTTATTTTTETNKSFGALQPNMVLTIEPGLYFCRPYIDAYFLRNDQHRKYIDREVLQRYWNVGGVRVEDCVLVTEEGFENLTTAPKGEGLLRIVGVA